MLITEFFSSIQGESTLAGIATFFIRCTGCNLDCIFCDTRYARTGGIEMTKDDILSRIEKKGLPAVCITGGEPLLQPETIELASLLSDRGYLVSIETNGSLPVSNIPERIIVVIDVKCPGSGESGSFDEPNALLRRPRDQFKFVISSREDFEYACNICDRYHLDSTNTVLFAPAWSVLKPRVLSEWILNERSRVRLNLQLHRIIWPDENKGR
jgi:7-carboxy-7-deazaguanine synthase